MSSKIPSEPVNRAERRRTSVLAELRADRLVPGLTAGLVICAMEVALATSFAALIFNGPLASEFPRGIGMALFSGTISLIITALLSSVETSIGGNQDVPAAIMGIMAATIAGSATAATGASTVTVIAVVALTTLATGLLFVVLGVFGLAGLIRFLPYPVAGGFLAGTGWLLVTGGIGWIAGVPFSLGSLPSLFAPDVLIHWLPGFIFGVSLLVLSEHVRHYLFLPGMITLGILLFYGSAFVFGATPQELSAGGWLLGPFPDDRLWPPIALSELSTVDWSLIARQLPNMFAAVALSSIALLLNISGLEVGLKRDYEVNREMRVAGLGNLLSGLGAGLVGYHQVSLTTLADRIVHKSRLPGLIGGLVTGAVLLFGASLLGYLPEMVFGGLLVFLGLSFMWEWLVAGWRRLPRIDYAIVVLILIVIALIGFLEGVVVGVLATVIMFVVNYSRTNVVKHSLSVANYRSRVTRPLYQRELLDTHGDQARILQLQGFLFFGTAQGLLEQIRQWVAGPEGERVRYLVLDFTRVTGLDTTALLSFNKTKQLAETNGLKLCLAGLSPEIHHQLEAGGFLGDSFSICALDTIDRALEWVEDQVLIDCNCPTIAAIPLYEQLVDMGVDETTSNDLVSYLERLELPAGALFIRRGDPGDTMYFVESGQVTAQIAREDGSLLRLETMMNGRVVGEMGFYLNKGRSADVVAETPSVVFQLSHEALARMEAEHPEAAAVLHRLIIRILSERVIHLMSTVDALQK